MSPDDFWTDVDEDRDRAAEQLLIDMPSPPADALCEMPECAEYNDLEEGADPLPAYGSYAQLNGDHVCLLYVCEGCMERGGFDDGYGDWPTDGDGKLVEPARCSS